VRSSRRPGSGRSDRPPEPPGDSHRRRPSQTLGAYRPPIGRTSRLAIRKMKGLGRRGRPSSGQRPHPWPASTITPGIKPMTATDHSPTPPRRPPRPPTLPRRANPNPETLPVAERTQCREPRLAPSKPTVRFRRGSVRLDQPASQSTARALPSAPNKPNSGDGRLRRTNPIPAAHRPSSGFSRGNPAPGHPGPSGPGRLGPRSLRPLIVTAIRGRGDSAARRHGAGSSRRLAAEASRRHSDGGP
jgi:hypothetical protein